VTKSTDFDINNELTLASLLFRLATRYYIQTMSLVTIEILEQKVLESTGKDSETLLNQIQFKMENCEPTLANFIMLSSIGENVSPLVFDAGKMSCGRPFYWRPGTKWLSNVTFSSGIPSRGLSMDKNTLNVLLHQVITYEKNAVETACLAQEKMKSLSNIEKYDAHKILLEELRCLHFLQATIGLFSSSNGDDSNIPSACLEPNLKPVSGLLFHSFHELSEILRHSYDALGQLIDENNDHKAVGFYNVEKSQLSFNFPFDLDNESVLHQLRRYGHPEKTPSNTSTTTIDPMG
jgi:hypothetical protein